MVFFICDRTTIADGKQQIDIANLNSKTMKKLSLLALTTILSCFIILPSCRNNDGPTSKEIVKECNNLLYQLGADSVVTYLLTGYYELNDPQSRCEL